MDGLFFSKSSRSFSVSGSSALSAKFLANSASAIVCIPDKVEIHAVKRVIRSTRCSLAEIYSRRDLSKKQVHMSGFGVL